MDFLIEKLNGVKDDRDAFKDWSLEEIHKLLNIYLIISKKEGQLFKLIYRYHGCDSWEDIFRDYDRRYLRDKADGVEVALKGVMEEMERINRGKEK